MCTNIQYKALFPHPAQFPQQCALKCNLSILFNRKSQRLYFHSQDVEIEPAVLKEFTPLLFMYIQLKLFQEGTNSGYLMYEQSA